MKRAQIHYVLLCYYPDYLEDALAFFCRFKQWMPGVKLLIVDNSPDLAMAKARPALPILKGDNSKGEFSGWQVGIDSIRTQASIQNGDLFIFANDTASRHRRLTRIDDWLFQRSFRQCLRSDGIAGEVNSSLEPMVLPRGELQSWVSTYFFALSGKYLNATGGQLIPADVPYPAALDVKNKKIVFDFFIDSTLAGHINEWLFPREGRKGWYKTHSSSAQQLVFKANMIYLEKSLSLAVCNQGGKIHPTYGHKLAMRYKRKMERAYEREKRKSHS